MRYPIVLSADTLQALVVAVLCRDHVTNWASRLGHRWAADPASMTDQEIDRVVQEAAGRLGLPIRWVRRSLGEDVVGEAMRPNWLARRVGFTNKIVLSTAVAVELDTVLHEIAHLDPDAKSHDLGFIMSYGRLLEHFLGIDRETFWEAYRESLAVARREVVTYVTLSFDGLFEYDSSLEASDLALEATG